MADTRAGLYLRVSQDRTGEGLAVDRQRQDGRRLVELRGWHLTGEYVDNDVSAAGRKRRPSFTALVDDIRARRLDVVVAWALDRLVRSPRDRLTLIEACRATGTSVALVRGSDIDLTTAAGRLTAGMLGEIAQHEIDVKSERQRRAIVQAVEAGKPPGGWRAFGFEPDGVTHHPAEAPLVVEAYRLWLSGASSGEVADMLHREHGPTPQGHRWTPKAVRVLLGNPRYAGLRGLRSSDPVTGHRGRWHEQTWPGTWEEVVAPETWQAAVALLHATAQPGLSPGGHRFRHLLSGVATCGICGRWMISGRTGGGARGKGARIYVCTSNRHVSRNAQALEDYVRLVMLARLRREDAVGLLALDATPGQVEGLRAEKVRLRTRLAGLADDYAAGILDRDQVRVAGDRLRALIADVDTRLGGFGEVDVIAPVVLAIDDKAAREEWDRLPLSTRRAAIARWVEVTVLRGRHGRPPVGLEFDPATVQIRWRDG